MLRLPPGFTAIDDSHPEYIDKDGYAATNSEVVHSVLFLGVRGRVFGKQEYEDNMFRC